MKTLSSLIFGLFVIFYAVAQEKAETEDTKAGPRISFAESTFDFGDIYQGDKVEHTFVFENTGTEPLIITNVQTTCGCTVPKWPREPIPPGQEGKIVVRFDSAGKINKVNKVVKIISNAVTPLNQVTISANILPAKKADSN